MLASWGDGPSTGSGHIARLARTHFGLAWPHAVAGLVRRRIGLRRQHRAGLLCPGVRGRRIRGCGGGDARGGRVGTRVVVEVSGTVTDRLAPAVTAIVDACAERGAE